MTRQYCAFCVLILSILLSCNIETLQAQDSLKKNNPISHSQLDILSPIKRGERLFHGLFVRRRKGRACIECHSLKHKEILNWNPTAREIAVSVNDKTSQQLKSILMNPQGKKMAQVHEEYQFSSDEVVSLRAYLKHIQDVPQDTVKPRVNKLILFMFLVLLVVLVLVDVFITHLIRFKWILMMILVVALGYQLKMLAHGAMDLGRFKDYAPDQPIKFSHLVHVNSNQIQCEYCHSGFKHSKTAGIPSPTLCLNCHIIVREGTLSGKFEINKIHKALDNNRSIQWVGVHHLPDHVYFSHLQHVTVGKQECHSCHGQVENMHILAQKKELSMGWCLECHQKTWVDFKKNGYYKEGFSFQYIDSTHGLSVTDAGGRECGRCHY